MKKTVSRVSIIMEKTCGLFDTTFEKLFIERPFTFRKILGSRKTFCVFDESPGFLGTMGLFQREKMSKISKMVFLVGAFLVKRARLQWLVFFVRLQSHSDWSTFLTIETTKTTKGIRLQRIHISAPK